MKATAGNFSGGALSVNIFFAISGYLVTQSFVARVNGRRGWLSFFLARVLRIMPGLIACVVVTTMVCAFASTLNAIEYWTARETWKYLASNIVLIHHNYLPGVFLVNPARAVVNSSIWTVRIEVGMYAATFLAGMIGAWKSKHVAAAVVLGLVVWCAFWPSWFVFYPHTLPEVRYHVLCYAIGALVCVFQVPRPIMLALCLGSTLLGIVVVLVGFDITAARIWVSVSVALGAIALGRTDARIWQSAIRFGDLSYGVFLYSAPVQQMLVWARVGETLESHLFWSAVLSLVLALASWRFVEAPMLKLKRTA